MSTLLPLFGLLSFSLLTPAAQAIPAPSTGIVNGQVEPGFDAVVGLGLDYGGSPLLLCTGSLITPRVVLSASHCSGDFSLEDVAQYGVAWFADEDGDPDWYIRLESGVNHPDYRPLVSGPTGTSDYGEYDLAVVFLEEDAPMAPTRIHPDALTDDDLGMPLFSVGFGLTSGSNQNSGGRKHSVELVLSEIWDMYLINDADDNPTEGTICSGDSGGPQFAQVDDSGEWVQVAVHSWGQAGCVGQSASTRVDVAWDWILDQVEAEHGSRDLCEINGRYDDGVCDGFCAQADPDCAVAEVVEPLELRGCSVVAAPAAMAVLLAPLGGLLLRRRR